MSDTPEVRVPQFEPSDARPQNGIGEDTNLDSQYPPPQRASADEDAAIPRTDGGRAALQFLAAAFVIESVTWSQPVSYGVLLNEYLTKSSGLDNGNHARVLLSLAGTCQSGLIYCTAPLVYRMVGTYPQYLKTLLWAGAAALCASQFLASFANEPYQIVLTQGILYSLGGSILFNGTFSLIPEWFVRRRGLASGICYAGTSVGGIFLPYLLAALLPRYGWRTTLRCLAIGSCVLLAPAVYYIRGRMPARQRGRVILNSPLKTSQMLSDRILWLYSASTVLQGLGYFMTTLYLPTFASSLRLSGVESSTTLSLVNGSALISRLTVGALADFLSPYMLASLTLGCSGLAVFLIWGIASTKIAPLMAFSAVFGLLCGGFTSLGSGLAKDLAGDDLKQSHLIFGLVSMMRGLGNILTSPLSSLLLKDPSRSQGEPSTVYATNFSAIVIFVGVSLTLSALTSMTAGLLRRRRRKAE